MAEREHRHPCPPPRLFAAQGNSTGTDQLLLYTFPVSTKVSNSSAASQSARPVARSELEAMMLGSVRMANLGVARGIYSEGAFEFVLHVEECFIVCGGASCVRDLGRAERPRADEEEENTGDTGSASIPTS